jgi:hypothetical protein
LNDYGKRFKERFHEVKDHPTTETKSYSETTTHITRTADGTVHEETTTTERLPDGTTKTTKLVKTPEGETRTETIVNKPLFKERFRALPGGEETSNSASAGNGSGDKHGNGNGNGNKAWWFWSRK